VKRREFITLIGGAAAAWPLAARAQQAGRIRRIGVLFGVSASDQEYRQRFDALKQALRELGWADPNISFEPRFAEGKLDRLPALAAELVNLRVDIIVTSGTELTQAAHKATSTIPIVMAAIGDAVGAGLASSLARPGGNVTGLTLVATEQGTKRLELIKEAVPNLACAAVLLNSKNASHHLQLRELELAAPKLGLRLQSVPVDDPAKLDAAFDAVLQADPQAILTLEDAVMSFLRQRIIELAMRHKLPVMGEFSTMANAGALMSYAPNQIDMWRSAARYVDKILKGANPAELPIERPTKFELVLNVKTAKALGIDMPLQLQQLADEVIE
jgi:putative tryptophan/tyrosine transport system substrate-binding protein